MTGPAERPARRPRSSVLGRLGRLGRWLGNRQSGPLPRARRLASVLRATVRDRGPIRDLPEALATAALAPVRVSGPAAPPKPARDWEPARAAAAERLAGFAARTLPARPRIAVIADEPWLNRYGEAWDVVAIRPEDWSSVLGGTPPDLLVVDAAHDGNHGAWAYRIAWTAHPDWFLQRDLQALTTWAAAHAIPSVFRAQAGGAASAAEWRDAARLFDLVVAPDHDAAAAYEATPDRRGSVRRLGMLAGASGAGGATGADAGSGASGADAAALLRAVRAPA